MGNKLNSNYTYSKTQRLRSKAEFEYLRSGAKKISAPNLFSYSKNINERSFSKIAFSVSKRCGNAVKRNFLKRKLRESFRKDLEFKRLPIDILIVINSKKFSEHNNLFVGADAVVKDFETLKKSVLKFYENGFDKNI